MLIPKKINMFLWLVSEYLFKGFTSFKVNGTLQMVKCGLIISVLKVMNLLQKYIGINKFLTHYNIKCGYFNKLYTSPKPKHILTSFLF